MQLLNLYLKAFDPILEYVKAFINHLLPTAINFISTGWLDFFHLGFTTLNELLIFVVQSLIFIYFHYLVFKLIKWSIKTIGGVTRVRR